MKAPQVILFFSTWTRFYNRYLPKHTSLFKYITAQGIDRKLQQLFLCPVYYSSMFHLLPSCTVLALWHKAEWTVSTGSPRSHTAAYPLLLICPFIAPFVRQKRKLQSERLMRMKLLCEKKNDWQEDKQTKIANSQSGWQRDEFCNDNVLNVSLREEILPIPSKCSLSSSVVKQSRCLHLHTAAFSSRFWTRGQIPPFMIQLTSASFMDLRCRQITAVKSSEV